MAVLCQHISAALIEADLFSDTADPSLTAEVDNAPVWLSSPGSVARNHVMVAAGMLSNHLGMPTSDALRVLKANAYANQSTTDETAAALIDGTITLRAFD